MALNQTDTALQIFTDGGSRGNPGPSACAFSVNYYPSLAFVYEDGLYLGQSTNNLAEYNGLILALSWLVENCPAGLKEVCLFSDSELMVNQINSVYRVKNPGILPLYTKAAGLINRFNSEHPFSLIIKHINRSLNPRADMLVNLILDKQLVVG